MYLLKIILFTLLEVSPIKLNHFLINGFMEKVSIRQNYRKLCKPISEHEVKNGLLDSFRFSSVFITVAYHVMAYTNVNQGFAIYGKQIYFQVNTYKAILF